MSKQASFLHAFPLATALALGGCASADVQDDGTDQSTDDLRIGDLFGGGGFHFGGSGGGVGQVVAGPGGVFTTLVHAKGTGCPKGTWTAGISPDGQTFTVTFNAYEARVSPGQSFDVRDCALDIGLVGTRPLTFTVSSFYYQGYAFLESGSMRAVQSAEYAFNPASLIAGFIPGVGGQIAGAIAGQIDGGVRSENVIQGPADRPFLHEDTVSQGRWSMCAPATNLRINTRMKLENNAARSAAGYMNTVTVDGKMSFGWKLSYKGCTPPPAPPSPTPGHDPFSGGG
jgi:hypothetical protein